MVTLKTSAILDECCSDTTNMFKKKNFAPLCLTCCAGVPHSFELKTCTSRNAEEVPGGVYLVHEGDCSGCHLPTASCVS